MPPTTATFSIFDVLDIVVGLLSVPAGSASSSEPSTRARQEALAAVEEA